ncbi:unnamed protein product, partial [Mesorhabditis belari]|uniref:Transcription factor Dp-1 n=1 Tax=Mesorhabditis belari TaxID=2138241 RepID=A0AAF3E9S8_9BILA
MYGHPSRSIYNFDQRPKVVPIYSRQKEFAVVAPPSRLSTSSNSSTFAGQPTSFRSNYGSTYAANDKETRRSYDDRVNKILEEKYGRMNKGLRHFSMKVCEKVKQKGCTSYNEVADELVSEYFDAMNDTPAPQFQTFDMKNIRRRVYDALNVLMAVNIIEKQNKEIRWNGLPTTAAQEMKILENEKTKKEEKLKEKYEQCLDLMMQIVAYKHLIMRNRESPSVSTKASLNHSVLYLPFLVVATEPTTEVDVGVAGDRSEFLFHLDRPFEMFDDVEALKRLELTAGLESQSIFPNEVRDGTKQMLPRRLRPFVDEVLNEVENARALERQASLRDQNKSHQSIAYARPSSIARVGQVSMQSSGVRPSKQNIASTTFVSMKPSALMRQGISMQTRKQETFQKPPSTSERPHTGETVVVDEMLPMSQYQMPHHTYQEVPQNLMEEVEIFDEIVYEDVGATEEIAYSG